MKRILFITSNRIGDAVLSSALLVHLTDCYPEARITVACGSLPAPLFEGAPFIERLIPLKKQKWAGHWRGLWMACHRQWWDLIVDLRGSAMAWLLPGTRRKVLGAAPKIHHRLYHLAGLFDLADPPAPRLWLDAKAHAQAASLLPADHGPVLALGPTANWHAKEWPADSFIAMAKALISSDGPLAGAKVAVFSAPDERDRALPVIQALPADRVLDCAGSLPLAVTAACLARADLYIGNDSGLMHISAAMGTKTLGLFGPSPDTVYRPWGDHCRALRGPRSYEDLCHRADFDHRTTPNLMGDLTIEAVIEQARAFYAPQVLLRN